MDNNEIIQNDNVDVVTKLSAEEEKAQRKRPDITHLSMAVDDTGVFIPGVGEKVVVEKVSSPIKGISHWLDTSVYVIKEFDDETGNLKMWNEEFGGFLKINYIDALAAGYSFRLPPGRGPFIKRKSRGRVPTKKVVVQERSSDQTGQKRRGRPKGSKNRSKDEIMAEKTERKAARAERKAASRR